MTQTDAAPRFTAREWNACGATQFYGKARKRSYIVEVSLSEKIHGDLLQQAMDKALQRLPYYGSTFVLMSETAGCFHFNFTQTIESDRYYLAFAAILEELGIPYEKLPCESYLNPVVELPREQG